MELIVPPVVHLVLTAGLIIVSQCQFVLPKVGRNTVRGTVATVLLIYRRRHLDSKYRAINVELLVD